MRGYFFCCYCGVPASDFDHVVPWSWNHTGKRKTKNRNKETCVGACSECNSLLSNYFLHSIKDRADYLSDRLALRYKDLLKMPVWSEEELDEMGYTQATYIRNKQMQRDLVIDRIRHCNMIRMMDMTIFDYWDKQPC